MLSARLSRALTTKSERPSHVHSKASASGFFCLWQTVNPSIRRHFILESFFLALTLKQICWIVLSML